MISDSLKAAKKLLRLPYCSAVIAAAGSSKRMRGQDKLFAIINGAPVLAHTLMVFQKCILVREIIVVTSVDNLERVAQLCAQYGIAKAEKIITGGSTRLDSVFSGVSAVSRKAKLIAIHDGARPCVSEDIILNTVSKASKKYAAAPAILIAPTLKKVKNGVIVGTIDRDDVYEIQTPQVFDADLIKAALTNAVKKSIDVTDDCLAAELIGIPVHITAGSAANIKLTTPEDIAVAEAVLSNLATFSANKEQVICGRKVTIRS